jgi:hypothetical protein
MPRHRNPNAARVVHRTARAGLRPTHGQWRRLLGLLASAGDVWCCMLEVNAWRQGRGDRPLASYQELCQELAASGPGTFGELDTAGARSVLRRYSDAWLATAKRRRQGDETARFPRRRRSMVPVRWYCGRFTVDGRRLRVPVAKGCPPLQVRLDRDVPYPPGQVRSVTLVYETGRLWVDVTAEVPVATYPAGAEPDAGRVAGVDPGIIQPLRRRRAARRGAAGVRAGDPRRAPPVRATATCPPRPSSPPGLAAGSRQPPRIQLVSRTAAPDHIFQVCPRRDVTRAAAPITAAKRVPGRHRPAPPRPTQAQPGSRSPYGEEYVNTRPYLRAGALT